MRKIEPWKVVAPLGLAAVGAAALAVITLLKPERPAAASPAAAEPGAPKKLGTGSYSFISGFQDAAPVELTLDYDAEKFSFDVVDEDFLCYTSDSHVALLCGEDFSAQIEYAGYYPGEGFEDLIRHVSDKYSSFAAVAYGDNTGIRYLDGDNVCLCFPADAYSYVLITLVKAEGNDEEIETLPDKEELRAMLGSMRISARR